MINCQKFNEQLYPFIDAQLDKAQHDEMLRHIEACPLCSLLIEKERKFSQILSNHIKFEPAPYALKERILGKVGLYKSSRSFWNFLSPPLWAGALVVIILVAVVFILPHKKNDLAFPVFAASLENHLEYLKGAYPLEFKTSDLNEGLKWFEGKVDFPVGAPHMRIKEIPLLGGRMMHLKDQKAAYLVFEKDGYVISALYADVNKLVLPKESQRDGIKVVDSHRLMKTENGFHVIFCHHPDETACIIITNMPLEKFKQYVYMR